jgi:membrane protease YdiL (CAAX protease family)
MGQRSRLGAALAMLTVHNLTQNTFLNERGYVAASLTAAAGMISLGRDAGLGWDDMSLTCGDRARTCGVGLAAVALGTAGVFLALTEPARPYLRDDRAPLGSRGRTAIRALTRFPLGTALFEEVAFRGVLPALLRQSGWKRPHIAAATIFGVWHLLPTYQALRTNQIGASAQQRLIGVVLGSTAAGVAGHGLELVRRYTGGLVGPWIVHSSINASAYLASVIART